MWVVLEVGEVLQEGFEVLSQGDWKALKPEPFVETASNVRHFGPPPNRSRQLAGQPATLGILDRPKPFSAAGRPPDPADLPCACSHLHTLLLHQDTPTTDGHYILTLDQLDLPPHLRIFLNANMNSTFYPAKTRYFLTFQAAFPCSMVV